jgi:hypothetical protein
MAFGVSKEENSWRAVNRINFGRYGQLDRPPSVKQFELEKLISLFCSQESN